VKRRKPLHKRLRHRIRIEVATETKSATGAVSRTWAEHKTVYAEKRTVGGNEFNPKGLELNKISVIFGVRWSAALEPIIGLEHDARIVDLATNLIYEIVPPINHINGQRRKIEISATNINAEI